MIELSSEDKELLISKVKDPLARAKIRFQTFRHNKEQQGSVAKEFLEAQIASGFQIKNSTFNESLDDAAIRMLAPDDCHNVTASYIAAKLRIAPDIKSRIDRQNSTSSLLPLVERVNCHEVTRPDALRYVTLELNALKNPTKDTKFETGNLQLVAQVYGMIDQKRELDTISVMFKVLNPPYHYGESKLDDSLKTPEVIDHAWDYALRFLDAKGSPVLLSALFADDLFRERHRYDGRAKKVARSLIEERLSQADIEKAQKIRDSYEINDVTPQVRKAARLLFSAGRIQDGDTLLKKFDYQLTDADKKFVQRGLQRAIQTSIKLQEFGSFDSHRRDDGSFSVFDHEERRLLFDDYLVRGFTNDLPRTNIFEGYHGKIMILKIGDIRYLWGYGDLHRDIVANFTKQARRAGITSGLDHERGAKLEFQKDNVIRLYGHSEDYGECDKNTAKTLIESMFPAKRVVIADSYRSEW